MIAPTNAMTLRPPCTLTTARGDRPIGRTVWLAIAAVQDGGGRVPLADLCRAVYGGPVPRSTIRALCHRANRQLEAAGAAARLTVEEGSAMLV